MAPTILSVIAGAEMSCLNIAKETRFVNVIRIDAAQGTSAVLEGHLYDWDWFRETCAKNNLPDFSGGLGL